jgi:hypothetical protein
MILNERGLDKGWNTEWIIVMKSSSINCETIMLTKMKTLGQKKFLEIFDFISWQKKHANFYYYNGLFGVHVGIVTMLYIQFFSHHCCVFFSFIILLLIKWSLKIYKHNEQWFWLIHSMIMMKKIMVCHFTIIFMIQK